MNQTSIPICVLPWGVLNRTVLSLTPLKKLHYNESGYIGAGIASRLRPLTDTTPKCLLKVGERCLLQRAFDALLQNGFREFVIVTGYRQQQIVNFLEAHYPALEVTFIYNEKYASTNNIYSLWLTRPYVDKEDILLLDSDILFDPRL